MSSEQTDFDREFSVHRPDASLPLMASSRDGVRSLIISVAMTKLGCDLSHLADSETLDDSSGVDSLTRMTLLCHLEDATGAEIFTGDLRSISCLGDLVAHVHSILVAKGTSGPGSRT